jgi:hypothetical protein
MSYSLNQLYQVVGISKQAVQQYARRQEFFDQKFSNLLVEADELRKAHPGCGVQKMYDTLKPDFIGRDRFIEAMMGLGYRLKQKKNYRRTTYPAKVYYPNLIGGLRVNAPNVVWQSDITYIEVGQRFYYAVFIIDVYTKTIVGYHVADHMRATANVEALQMAIKQYGPPQIHHSDRGSQYIYSEYLKLLKENKVEVSMGLCAQENAYAERINRTIKEEYLDHWKPQNFAVLKRYLKKAIHQYNTQRPHDHLSKMNPTEYVNYWKGLSSQERPVLTIFDYQNSV